MARGESSESSDTIHILHTSYDNEDRAALTFLANDVRFHITADPQDLQKSSDKTLYYEYLDKVTGLRDAEQREYDVPQRTLSSPNKTNGNKKQKKSADADSAVDVTADDDDDDEGAEDEDQDSASAEADLRKWMLDPMIDTIATHAPPGRAPEPSSVWAWYHGPTYFYALSVASGELVAELVEENEELEGRIEKLVPHMKMPQYITRIEVPWWDAGKLTVHSEVDFPEPAHPGRVSNEKGEVFFFKPVTPGEPGPVKREISILRKIEDLGLDIKVPRLVGFVGYGDSGKEVMGFLLSHIEAPTPLTNLLSSSVSQEKRDAWSKKSKEYIDTLHEHDIVWGDAKADNFMVDAEDELWIIDFGGSYTEGWVDPELSESLEGDEQGLQKVREALECPEGGADEDGAERSATPDPSATVKETASSLFVTEAKGRKRSHAEDDGDESGSSKRRREEADDA